MDVQAGLRLRSETEVHATVAARPFLRPRAAQLRHAALIKIDKTIQSQTETETEINKWLARANAVRGRAREAAVADQGDQRCHGR